ncbi:hypothetical protein Taro_032991, partial [Colocasia esculenta]|nr:hypothetical protein [Colocasia esculenta]
MERFKRMSPPSFKGESDPLLAESWMREIEKIFWAIRCAEDDKVTLATYMLQERADVWWSSHLRTRFEDGAVESTEAKEIEEVKVELQKMRSELGSMKQLMTSLSDFVRVQLSSLAPPAPTQQVSEEPAVGPSRPVVVESGPSGSIAEEDIRPPGPSEEESRPLRPTVQELGPPRPSMEESGATEPSAGESGPSGQVKSKVEQVRIQEPVEVAAVPPEPPIPSSLQTLAPSSPPSSSTAPLESKTLKQPLPKHISSPTPFPTTSSSPISSTAIPPPPTFEKPPASSSASPSSTEPSIPPPTTSSSSFYPPTPPSFITIIPEGARIQCHIIQDIKDEFEEAILRSILSISSH